MIEKISFQYPGWFLLVCLVIAFAYSYLLYKREAKFKDSGKWVKPSMSLLRFLSVLLILLLLLSIFIKSLKEEKKEPIVVLAQDRSTSITAATNKDKLIQINNAINDLKKSLQGKYEVQSLYFSEDVSTDKDSFGGKSSNLSNVVNYIYENYADQNIGAIILSSDGIYNEGSNPTYENVKFNAPLHTIALGDTTIRKDLLIKNVLHNKIAYLGDQFMVQVDIAANNCANNNTKLRVEKVNEQGRKLISEYPLNIDNPNYFNTQQILLEADETGIVKYTLSLTSLNGEISSVNNRRDIYVEILDGRQNILIFANAPHPDIAAFNSIITNNKNYKVTTAFAGNDKVTISDYDLIIMHNLPSETYDATAEMNVINNKNIPILFIAGTQINQTKFNAAQDVIKIKGNNKTNEDVEPTLNSTFNLFTLSDGLKSFFGKFPPFVSQFGTFEATATANVLLYQKIKKIPTKYPLFAYGEKSGVKTGVIAGEGIWKWKISDFVENGNYDNISELVNKSIQLLTVKDDKRKFRVNLAKNLFKENENILFEGQLYNDAYEMINEPDVNLTIKDQNKKEYKYSFSKTNNYYTLDAGLFPEGSYNYTATTNYKGNPLVATGKFSIQSIQLEQYNLTARHDVLRSLSQKFYGKTYYPDEIKNIAKDILDNKSIKPMIFTSTSTKSLIHFKWLFLLILLLLSAEWFMRRYFGSY
jgi:hypothetical protein